MSRAYRISISESLRRHVQIEDGVRSSLEVLPVLPKERMVELLAEELARRGFHREEGRAVREQDGIRVAIALDSGEVTATAARSEAIELEASRTAVTTTEQRAAVESAVRQRVQAELERAAQGRAEAIQKEVTRKLESALRELGPELDAVVNRVTAEALKAKARELGTIEEISEDESGSLTIKVRV